MKNESIHILNFNENFNEIENYDVLNIEQRIRDIVTDLEDKQYFLILEEPGRIGILSPS